MSKSYQDRVANQIDQFRNMGQLKKLPSIFRYWNQTYVVPKIADVFGHRSIWKIYDDAFVNAMDATGVRKILSIGSGDCNVEINMAERLVKAGIKNFQIECTDLSDIRLDRGRAKAKEQGLESYLTFESVDVNHWDTDQQFAGLMAHHTLHHIVDLEGLFERMNTFMQEDSVFVCVDMIGRNGHMRWPETLHWVEAFWAQIPDHYKFNHQFEKQHEEFVNFDCSKSGFEGIRAQDIMLLMLENFTFTHFVGVGGIIDPFVERGYGHNISPEIPEDKMFIDSLAMMNEYLIDIGRIKPTMIFAILKKNGVSFEGPVKYYKSQTPEFCTRFVEVESVLDADHIEDAEPEPDIQENAEDVEASQPTRLGARLLGRLRN